MKEPVFTAHDGRVFYRGTYRTPDECERLLATLRRQSIGAGWWPPEARALAAELETAMRTAGIANNHQEAA